MDSNPSFVKLKGSLAQISTHATPLDEVPDGKQLIYAHIVLRSRTNQYPSMDSVEPGHFYSLDDYTKSYGANPQELDEVRKWYVEKYGLTCTSYSTGARILQFTGTLDQYARAFQTTFLFFEQNDRKIISHRGELSIPESFQHLIRHVGGLNTIIPLPRPRKPFEAPTNREFLTPRQPIDSSINAAFYAKHYQFPERHRDQTLDGDGQIFGIIALGGDWEQIKPDVDAFVAELGLPDPKIKIYTQANYSATPPEVTDPEKVEGLLIQSNAEVALDLAVALPVIPNARIEVYFGQNSLTGLEWAFTTALFGTDEEPKQDSDVPTAISLSWSFPEEGTNSGIDHHFLHIYRNLNEYFIKPAVMMGVSILACSGDFGSSNQSAPTRFSVSCPSSSPYCLSVGGTFLDTQKKEEQIWNQKVHVFGQSFDLATGGGFSKHFQAPDYQAPFVEEYWSQQSPDPAVTNHEMVPRGIPDVAAVANSDLKGYYAIINGTPTMAPGGTSAATPLWGTLLVKIAQALGTRLGNVTSMLYQAASQNGQETQFISLNGKKTNCMPQDIQTLHHKWEATEGWNPCTGLGSPNGEALLTYFQKRFAEKLVRLQKGDAER